MLDGPVPCIKSSKWQWPFMYSSQSNLKNKNTTVVIALLALLALLFFIFNSSKLHA